MYVENDAIHNSMNSSQAVHQIDQSNIQRQWPQADLTLVLSIYTTWKSYSEWTLPHFPTNSSKKPSDLEQNLSKKWNDLWMTHVKTKKLLTE